MKTGMASFCKPPPTAEQREQQHLEEGQKFKQRVQKQRADNQQRAAEAAKHKRKPGTHGRLRHAQHSQQGQNEAAGEQAPGPRAEEDEERRAQAGQVQLVAPSCLHSHHCEEGSDAEESEEGGNEEGGNEERDGEEDGDDT